MAVFCGIAMLLADYCMKKCTRIISGRICIYLLSRGVEKL